MPTSAISLHVVLDGCGNPEKDRSLTHFGITRPGYVNVTAAAQYNDSFGYMERVKAHSPETTILFRGYDKEEWQSDGLWDNKTDEEWFNHLVKPRVNFFRDHGIVVVLSNESVVPTQRFIDREKGAIYRCADVGVRCAALLSNTGTPKESDYPIFDPILKALVETGGVLAPHEYTHPEQRWKSGNLGRFLWYWGRLDANEWPRIPTVIQEFGSARNINGWIDAHNGYKVMGLSGGEFAELVITDSLEWHVRRGVHSLTFCFGWWKNNSFSVNDDEAYLEAMEEAATSGRIASRPLEQIGNLPPSIPPPTDEPDEPEQPPAPTPPDLATHFTSSELATLANASFEMGEIHQRIGRVYARAFKRSVGKDEDEE